MRSSSPVALAPCDCVENLQTTFTMNNQTGNIQIQFSYIKNLRPHNCFVYRVFWACVWPFTVSFSLSPSASYLPGPSTQQYQFVYVDGRGEACSRSTAFTFSAPKPMEELMTLEEEGQGEEVGEDMLLVIPRAQLLQVR